MRVLMATNAMSKNKYLDELVGALSRVCTPSVGLDAFYDGTATPDIVHIQWPEALVDWATPTAEAIERVEGALDEWGRRCPIVLTRHNHGPHASDDESMRRLYDLVRSRADAVVHMGQHSVEDYAERHRHEAWFPRQLHAVIPHPEYTQYPNDTTRGEARSTLGIADDRAVVLVIGGLRDDREVELVRRGFAGCRHPRKFLLAPKWPWPWIPGWLPTTPVRRLLRAVHTRHPRHRIEYGTFVDDRSMQNYLNAADVVLVPRLESLNSGLVPLACAFSRVVVGPRLGNIAGLLEELGNPVFDPARVETVGAALDRGLDLAANALGDANLAHARAAWSRDVVGEAHRRLYVRASEARRAGA